MLPSDSLSNMVSLLSLVTDTQDTLQKDTLRTHTVTTTRGQTANMSNTDVPTPDVLQFKANSSADRRQHPIINAAKMHERFLFCTKIKQNLREAHRILFCLILGDDVRP